MGFINFRIFDILKLNALFSIHVSRVCIFSFSHVIHQTEDEHFDVVTHPKLLVLRHNIFSFSCDSTFP